MPRKPIKTTRIIRSAKHIPHGMEIYNYLRQPDIVAKMIVASDQGDPAISVVSHHLLGAFGKEVLDNIAVRQFIGMAVKLIMQENSYEIAEKGIRIPRDLLFVSGSAYRKVEKIEDVVHKLSLASVNAEGETLAFRLFMALIDVATPEERIIMKRVLIPILQKSIERNKKSA